MNRTTIDYNIDGRTRVWLKGRKAKPFRTLFNSIVSKLGTQVKAAEYAGLSKNAIHEVVTLKITTETARKILAAHKRLN